MLDIRCHCKVDLKYLSQVGLAFLLAAILMPAGAAPAAAQEPTGSAETRPVLNHHPVFTHLTTEQGLSDIRVSEVLQDQAGFMWFGTPNGLNRYDGYNIVAYRSDPANPYSLSSNLITDLYEDRSGTLWVGTRGGLNAFDRGLERFTHYLNDPEDPGSLSDNSVTAIYEDRAGVLWVGTRSGLNRFDRESGSFTRYRHDEANPQSLSNDNVWDLYEDRAGVLWVGTLGGGLNRFDRESGSFTRYRHDEANPQSLSHNNVWDIYEDHTGVLWLATDGGGLNRFDRESETFTQYRHDPEDPHSLGADRLDCLFEDASGALWIGTYGAGLSVLDPARERFNTYKRNLMLPTSLSEDYVTEIVADRSGLIWLATAGGGVNLYDPQGQAFTIYRHDPTNPHSLASDRIDGVIEAQDGILWVGTQDQGLDRFDRRTGQVVHYPPDPENPEALGHPLVRALAQDPSGALWVGTYGGGLYRLDPESGRFTAYRHDPADPNSLSDDYIFALHMDRSGKLWIGTAFGGLARLDPTTSAFTAYLYDPADPQSLSSNNVWTIDEDQQGNIWTGTLGGGLNRLEPATGQITRYQHDPDNPASLSENNVWNIHFDRAGVLWLGTVGGGLDRFDPTTGTFSHYREQDGLGSDRIVSILEDDEGGEGAAGNLWIATGRGLSKLDQDRKTFHSYGTSDGLPLAEYNRGHYKSRSGELVLSSAQGLIVFDPAAIKGNQFVPPIVFTAFQLAGKPAPIGADSPLRQAINQTDSLSLTYADRVISFEFAALSYRTPQQNRYRYQLEGFDPAWIEVDSKRRLATYTNLDPGAYVFRVTGSNSAGLWNETGRTLTLIITPPWWETWWFYGLLLSLVMVTFATVYIVRVNALKGRQRRLEALVVERTRELGAKNQALEAAKNQAEAANQAKSIFLARMSHELRTPLTTILGYTQLMQHDPVIAASQQAKLNTIDRSGNHLLALIDDVLEMSRIEAGRITLNPESFDPLDLLASLEAMFHLEAEDKGLQFSLSLASELPRQVEADRHKLQQVLLNLLSNAFKFTQQGSVTLRVEIKDEGRIREEARASVKDESGKLTDPSAFILLTFEVEDTGPGLSEEEIASLFQPFVQGQAGQKALRGTGLGLAISRQFVQLMGGELHITSAGPSQGATFSFEIPVRLLAEGMAEGALGHRVRGLAAGQPAYRLLVVEDNADNRRWLIQLLAEAGFEARPAEDGQQAVQRWTEWQPHLILMDMGMPLMDGREATQQIRAAVEGQETKIIAVTGSAFEEERAALLAVGCDDFLRKPFREGALFELLARHLGVVYVYEETPVAEPVKPVAPVAGALVGQAPARLERLEYAVARSDIEKIEQAIAEIRAENPGLGGMLAGLAADFKYNQILELIQEAKRFSEQGSRKEG